MDHQLAPGLYIVATPIGNLGDITFRAVEVLKGVAAVACEDTRVTGKLLNHLNIKQKLIRYDDHASKTTRDYLLGMMAEQPIALVSDAGTPLVSDPGYRLVRAAQEEGLPVRTVPGPSAKVQPCSPISQWTTETPIAPSSPLSARMMSVRCAQGQARLT